MSYPIKPVRFCDHQWIVNKHLISGREFKRCQLCGQVIPANIERLDYNQFIKR